MAGNSQAMLEQVEQFRMYFVRDQLGPYEIGRAFIRLLEEVTQFELYAQMSVEDFIKQQPDQTVALVEELKACAELLKLSTQLQIDYITLLNQRRQDEPQLEITKELLEELKLKAAMKMLESSSGPKI